MEQLANKKPYRYTILICANFVIPYDTISDSHELYNIHQDTATLAMVSKFTQQQQGLHKP